MSTANRQDINDVLNNVIDSINRITDHLREHGENEAANQLSRRFTATFQELYGVIAPWNIQQCLMSPLPPAQDAQDRTQPPPLPVPSTTWATVAATAPANGVSGALKVQPSEISQQCTGVEEQRENPEDKRVIWIQPWEEDRSLSEISSVMHEIGPIYSMAYAPAEVGVCIVFQLAQSAQRFLNDCTEYINRTGYSPFGSNIKAVPGLPYAADADIRRMDAPENARRRLTFARQQLFANGITENRFRKDIEHIVGPQNIELLWLFNTGNATVVLSAVPLAKLVKSKFLADGRKKGSLYEGVMVTYSHDPCERELRLVSQIPGHVNYVGDSNGAHKLSHGGNGISGSSANRNRSSTWGSQSRGAFHNANSDRAVTNKRDGTPKKFGEDEGWQTVKKRR